MLPLESLLWKQLRSFLKVLVSVPNWWPWGVVLGCCVCLDLCSLLCVVAFCFVYFFHMIDLQKIFLFASLSGEEVIYITSAHWANLLTQVVIAALLSSYVCSPACEIYLCLLPSMQEHSKVTVSFLSAFSSVWRFGGVPRTKITLRKDWRPNEAIWNSANQADSLLKGAPPLK